MRKPKQQEFQARKIRDILFWPTSCLMQITPLAAFIFVVLIIITGIFFYTRVNFNFWGLTAIDYSEYAISRDFGSISNASYEWSLSFEKPNLVEFKGKIRHISPIRMRRFQILSHDVLVTSDDFANPDLVKTAVANHMFTWRSSVEGGPKGSINLLHTVPKNQNTYDQLWELKQNDWVIIKGYEILKIKLIDDDTHVNSWWEDRGCNTLLVTSIQIITE